MTLVQLARAYATGSITPQEVTTVVESLPRPKRAHDGEDTYYTGDPQNTLAAVEALVPQEITYERWEEFLTLVEKARGVS